MTFSKRMMLFNIFLLALSASILWVSCDTGTNPDPSPNPTPAPGLYANDPAEPENVTFSEAGNYNYPKATINVDYSGENNAVFFDFSTGTKTVLTHDFFDIAISGGGDIIANSGSYGSGVKVYGTEETDIAGDFSGEQSKIQEYTFKPTFPPERLFGYQAEVNPLGSVGMGASTVRLIKVQYKSADQAAYFKLTFSMKMPGAGGHQGPPQYVVTVVPGLGAGETNKKELVCVLSGLTGDAGYGWLYFKLVGDGGPRVLNNATAWTGGGTAVPKAADWDILATRTNELQSTNGTTIAPEMPVASRSSVLLNTYKKVQAKVVTGKLIDEVSDIELSDNGMSPEIDAIGYGWYSMTGGMPPTFLLAGNTYIIKTVEEHYVKFQPESFYGPNSESFFMDFSYYYNP
jgi:hypothetical protein